MPKYKDQIDENSMFCAGVDDGKDSCSGDSGGPIFDKASGAQVRTVSWGIGCARKNAPGMYGRIAGQIQWVQDTICVPNDTEPDFCANRDLPSQLTYKVVVKYDKTTKGFGWKIKDVDSGVKVVDYPVGSIGKAYAKINKEFVLEVGHSYKRP